MNIIKKYFNTLLNLGASDSDDETLKLKKSSLIFVSLIIAPAGFIWGSVFILLGQKISGYIPLSYSVISIINLYMLHKTKNIIPLQKTQFVLVLLLPFFLMWSLGGFASGSYVMIWAFYAPIAALIYETKKKALYWYLAFMLLVLFSTLINQFLISQKLNVMPQIAIELFYWLNISAGLSGVYFLIQFFIEQKDKNADSVLQQKHNSLLVAKKELEISSNKLENIFNITPNITLLTNGKTLLKANKEFYNFTGYATLEDFLKDYNCICDMFIERHGYLNPMVDGVSWIEYAVLNQGSIHKAIIEKDGEENLFLINAIKYYEDDKPYFIAVFENITELQKVAYTDHLTKLMNRVKIDEMLERCTNSYKRYKNIYSIILLDIDHFKLVNDTYGHLVGDDILKHIAIILNENTRNVDLVGRWGGEEFLIISRETDITGAFVLAEKIRKSVELYKFEITTHQTISLGVAQIKENETVDELIKRADNALYEAKEGGRNRVVISD